MLPATPTVYPTRFFISLSRVWASLCLSRTLSGPVGPMRSAKSCWLLGATPERVRMSRTDLLLVSGLGAVVARSSRVATAFRETALGLYPRVPVCPASGGYAQGSCKSPCRANSSSSATTVQSFHGQWRWTDLSLPSHFLIPPSVNRSRRYLSEARLPRPNSGFDVENMHLDTVMPRRDQRPEFAWVGRTHPLRASRVPLEELAVLLGRVVLGQRVPEVLVHRQRAPRFRRVGFLLRPLPACGSAAVAARPVCPVRSSGFLSHLLVCSFFCRAGGSRPAFLVSLVSLACLCSPYSLKHSKIQGGGLVSLVILVILRSYLIEKTESLVFLSGKGVQETRGTRKTRPPS